MDTSSSQEHLLDFLVLVLDPDPGRPVPSVDAALPLDEGRGQLDGPVDQVMHRNPTTVTEGAPDAEPPVSVGDAGDIDYDNDGFPAYNDCDDSTPEAGGVRLDGSPSSTLDAAVAAVRWQ